MKAIWSIATTIIDISKSFFTSDNSKSSRKNSLKTKFEVIVS